MSQQFTLFYQGKQQVNLDFSAEAVSSDGAIVLSRKLERKYKLIEQFCKDIPEFRDPRYIDHSIEEIVSQRVFLMMQGYDDCNDVERLKDDPVVTEMLGGGLCSQPSVSRFENSISIRTIYELSLAWIDRYVSSIKKGRKKIIIDVDGTDDPAHGAQQLALFNGYYGQFMYHILLFKDGDSGQIILPVLRPGNTHSSRWFVKILGKIVDRIRTRFPEIEIIIRADCGFSVPDFYALADSKGLKFCVGISANERLKKVTAKAEKIVRTQYLEKGLKHQHFMGGFTYQADTWQEAQTCYAKVESTGKGMNVRYFISNLPEVSAREIYLGFYVKRGDTSENRIKELKNMCYADRLSCHKFTANYLRLFFSCLCYEFYGLIKTLIRRTTFKQAHTWQIDNIRLYIMKVGAIIKKMVRSMRISFSKAYICQDLFASIIQLC